MIKENAVLKKESKKKKKMQFFKNGVFKQPFMTWENYHDAMLNEKASDKSP